MSEMNLGDGFSRRKQIQSEFDVWLNRLSLAGREETHFSTKELGDSEENAVVGSLRKFGRNFSIEECLSKLDDLLEEDKTLAKRISLTNQQARAVVMNIEGNKLLTLTIPELIVLKNDITPKLNEIEEHIPQQTAGKEVLETKDKYIKWREIKTIISRTRKVSKEGFQMDVDVLKGYNVKEIVDYGYNERELLDRKDKLREWEGRLKKGINEANKTILINL